MVKRFFAFLLMTVMVATIALPAPAFAAEGVSERQQRKRIEAQKYPNQAQEALNANNPDLAIDLFTKAINSHAFDDQPDAMGNLYFGRGNAHRRKSDWTAAIADYTKALEFSKKGDIYFSRAACYLELKQDDLALADIDTAIKTDPDAVSYRSARCIMLFNRKDFAGALPDCEKALAATPNDKNLLTATAQSAEQTGNAQRAAELYRRLLAADPGNPIATEGLQRTGS